MLHAFSIEGEVFAAIPARLFRHDVSLTEIRAALKEEVENR